MPQSSDLDMAFLKSGWGAGRQRCLARAAPPGWGLDVFLLSWACGGQAESIPHGYKQGLVTGALLGEGAAASFPTFLRVVNPTHPILAQTRAAEMLVSTYYE